MRTLYLLRHAKSSWRDPGLADFERPLARRGRKACIVMAQFIKSNSLNFDLVLSSTALRARETIEQISLRAELRTPIRFDERIYDANLERLIEVTSEIENSCKAVLLVGHNPGFEELLAGLTTEAHELPTASLVKIKLKVSKWADVQAGKGTLEWIQQPKNLE